MAKTVSERRGVTPFDCALRYQPQPATLPPVLIDERRSLVMYKFSGSGWSNYALATSARRRLRGQITLRGRGFLEAAGSRCAVLAVLAGITGLYYLIVATTNCVDTDTNRGGVAAVLSMRQTIHHPGVDWRAITSGSAVWTVYILIVIWEFLTAFVLLLAAVAWWRVVAGRLARDNAVRLASIGWTMAVLQFLGGFLTIGEWFRMWGNTAVNATSAALQNFLIAAVGLILVHLPERPVQS
jgi:predicted small integral membrane protein